VLDIGCGSGVYSVELAKRGAKRVLGIDFSEPMLALARDSAAKLGVADRAEFIKDEFLAHPFGDETFDVTIAMGVFDYLEEPAPFPARVPGLRRARLRAPSRRSSRARGTARRLRSGLTRRGDVFYYEPAEVSRLAEQAGLKRHRLEPVDSSGGGVILVGD